MYFTLFKLNCCLKDRDLTRRKPRVPKFRGVSEKQEELEKQRWAKTDKPNPFTYNTSNAVKFVKKRIRVAAFTRSPKVSSTGKSEAN